MFRINIDNIIKTILCCEKYSTTKLHGCGGNNIYQVDSDDNQNKLVVKQLNPKYAFTNNEYKYAVWANNNNIGPKIYQYEDYHLIMEYIEDDKQMVDIEILMSNLKNMHNLPLIDNDTVKSKSFLVFCNEYDNVQKYITEVPEYIKYIFDYVATTIEKLSHSNQKIGICHNDLHRCNILQSDNRLKFIDWTYAGLDYILIDISQTAILMELNPYECLRLYYQDDINEDILELFSYVIPLPYAYRALFPLMKLSKYNIKDVNELWKNNKFPHSSIYLKLLNDGKLVFDNEETFINFSLSFLKSFYDLVK